MKEKRLSFKSYAAGVLSGVVIVGGLSYAAGSVEWIEAVINGVNITSNGAAVDVPSVLYNGTTYVGVRSLSELFGKNIGWDDETKTVMVDDMWYASSRNQEVVGSIDGMEVTVSEIMPYILSTGKSTLSLAEKQDILNDMLRNKQSQAKAAELGVELTEDEEGMIIEMLERDADSLQSLIDSVNITKDEYYQITRQMFLNNKLGEYLAGLPENVITDEKAEEHYVNSPQYAGDYVQAKHILINFDDGEDKALELANSVYKKAISGEDFDDLVSQYGKDPGVQPDGYVFGKGEMVKEFEEASFALKKGEISTPVKTSYGYHIIKKIDAFDRRPFKDVVASIKTEMSRNKVMEIFDSWFNGAQVTINDDVLNSLVGKGQ